MGSRPVPRRGWSKVAVAAHGRDGAGLRPPVTQLLHEAHLRPHLQVREVRLQDTVPVEVDLPPVGRLEEAVAGLREEPGDAGVGGRLVGLDPPPPAAGIVLQLAPRLVERVANRDVDVTISGMFARLALDRDLFAGDLQVDSDLVEVPLL